MMRDPKTWLAVPALLVALSVACDKRPDPATQDARTGPATTEQAPDGSPGTTHPDRTPNNGDAPAIIVGGDHATDPPTPELDPPARAQSDTPAPAAGRSPFPEEGERLRTPIAAPRLSDHDPFEIIIDPEAIPDIVPWEQAGGYLGHEIIVEGRIVNIGQTRSGDIFFLNFHREWRGKFYMVIFDDLADTLEQSVADTFEGKLVRVQGLVEPHRGRPQIKIMSMDQVEFVEE
ncbi:MAG: hypothetical protein AAGA29_06920 [Planctomycetota bacterium]